MGDWESKNLVNELTKGKELARQLQIHINTANSNSNSNNGNSWSQETCEYLVQKILVSFEKGISMLNWPNPAAATSGDQLQLIPPLQTSGGGGIPMSESPPSHTDSPRSDQDSDRDQENRDSSKKRKSMPRWTKQVKVNPGVGLEGPLDDGFSWRKYGQKDILGARYPRGYYRCTHRSIQGCLATKQVQRSDEDPTIFEITYRGKHTCNRAANTFSPSTTTIEPSQENQEPIPPIKNDTLSLPQSSSIIHHQNMTNSNQNIQIIDQQPQLHDEFKSTLKVITQGLDNDTHNFHFVSASNDSRFVLNDNSFASGGGFSPTSFHVSPAVDSSGTNYFSMSRIEEQLRVNQNFHNPNSEPEIGSEINNPNVANNLDIPFGYIDDQLDTNFTFGHPGYL